MNTSLDLVNQPIPELVKKLAAPASIGFLFNTMFNVVDAWYGGLISTDALAALSVAFPVFFIIIAIGSGVGTATTALVAIALGAGDRKDAERWQAQAVAYGIVVSLLVTLTGLCASPALFSLLGASGAYLEAAVSYMNVIFAGSIFFVMSNILNASLTAAGDTVTFRNTLIAGSLFNLVLDPWLIYGGLGIPPMGFDGIAISTVAIQGATAVYIGITAYRRGVLSCRRPSLFFPRAAAMAELSRHAVPACMNMLTVGIGIFIITYFVSIFGKNAVAAYGIAVRIEQIVLLPAIGFSISTLALSGQNYGAARYERIRETIRISLTWGFFMMVGGGVMLYLSAPYLMAVFTDDAEIIGIGSGYLRVAALLLWAYIVLFVETSALQGVKQPMFAIWVGLYRQIAAPFCVFYLLTNVLDVAIGGIWWGIFCITWSAALFTAWYARREINNIIATGRAGI